MTLQNFKKTKQDEITRSMTAYLTSPDCQYTQSDIDKCSQILDDYIDDLIAINENPASYAIIEAVKTVVIKLNELNSTTNIIETDQREHLCPFIQDAAITAGLPKPLNDITEEWRLW